nr:hypothetical protein CFP56_70774 [Quercus suber]
MPTREQAHLLPTAMTAEQSLPATTTVPTPLLPSEINAATQKQHIILNRLIIARLGLALPPHARDPTLLGYGLATFAQIYQIFEEEWSKIERKQHDRVAAPDHPEAILCYIATLRPAGLSRTHRLQSDLAHLAKRTGDDDFLQRGPIVDAQGDLRALLQQKPHVLLAFAWRDAAGVAPRLLERGDGRFLLDLRNTPGEVLPTPAGFDFGAEDAVAHLGEARVGVAMEPPELRARRFQHQQALDGAGQRDARAASCHGFRDPGLGAVAQEGVRVGLAVDGHAGPAVHGDGGVRDVEVRVGVEEVLGEDGGEELGRVDRVQLGHEVDGLLLRVRRHDVGVVGRRPRRRDVALQHRAHRHLRHILGAVRVALDFVHPDVVFSVARVGKRSHDDRPSLVSVTGCLISVVGRALVARRSVALAELAVAEKHRNVEACHTIPAHV